MRRWGLVVSLVYAFIVIGLLVPAGLLIAGDVRFPAFFNDLKEVYGEWVLWIPVAMLIVGQAVLLFLSVDTSQMRLRPRSPVLLSAIATGMLLLLMTLAAMTCVGVAIYSDDLYRKIPDSPALVFGFMGLVWIAWAAVFYVYLRGTSDVTTRAMKWLLRGSVLELLIAVPCHVIVRRRDDCCAPIATSFGITAGIAVMLIAFGPSVLLLYMRRLDAYRTAADKAQQAGV